MIATRCFRGNLAALRANSDPGPAGARGFGGSALDPLSCAIALEALGLWLPRRWTRVFAVRAPARLRRARCGQHGSDEQKAHYLRACAMARWSAATPLPSRRRFGHVLHAHACRTPRRRMEIERHQDIHLQRAGRGRCRGIRGDRPGEGLSRRHHRLPARKSMPGLSAGQKFEKLGLRTSPVGELVFDDLDVARRGSTRQGRRRPAVFGTAMDWERCCSWRHTSERWRGCWRRPIEYARTRKQFGQAIGKFQAVSQKIADMKVQLEAARLLTYRAAWKLDPGPRHVAGCRHNEAVRQ